jgi:hypothetical protein
LDEQSSFAETLFPEISGSLPNASITACLSVMGKHYLTAIAEGKGRE